MYNIKSQKCICKVEKIFLGLDPVEQDSSQ